MNYFLIFFLGFMLTEISTPYIIKLFQKHHITEKMNERKIHTTEVPKMGGVILYSIIMLLFITFFADTSSMRLFILGSFIIFICGFFDDLFDLSWKVKFVVQGIASLFLTIRFAYYFHTVTISTIILPAPFSYFVIFFFILGTINSINLLDGLDGLVIGFAVICSIFIGGIVFYNHDLLLMVLIAAIVGSLISFSRYNSFPAKIFLGDTGSLLLGYFLVFISIDVFRTLGSRQIDLCFPILLLGLPIVDTLKVMFVRIKKGRHPFVGDNNHLHHILLNQKIRHKTSVFLIHILSIMFMSNAFIYFRYNKSLSLLIFILLSAMVVQAKNLVTISNPVILYLKSLMYEILELPAVIKEYYEKIIIWISIPIFIILITAVMRPVTAEPRIIYTLLFVGIILIFVSTLHQKRNKSIGTIYVFLNLLFLFSINLFLARNSSYFYINLLNSNNNFFYYSFYSLTFLVILFLIARYSFLSKAYLFLMGPDLMLISIILVFFIAAEFSKWKMAQLNYYIMVSLILYLWFKIILVYRQKVANVIFYGLFMVNIIILIMSSIY